MKRFLLACFLLTATCTIISAQHASAQTVTQASFMTKVNAMDAYTAAGDNTNAQATWTSIHTDMLSVLATSKKSIFSAATPTDSTHYRTVLNNQISIYKGVWDLHTDLVTNRTTLYNQLGAFDATIY